MIYRILILIGLIALIGQPQSENGQRQESFEGFVRGIRANAVKGEVFYQREDGKFNLEPGHKLQEGDLIKTEANSYAELLLQPGNYLRVGPESEIQIFSDPNDKMRLKLNRGAISLEIMSKDGEGSFFYDSLSQVYELTRIITPNAEVFITRSGIFRINTFNADRTDLIVRNGEAVINGKLVKEKRIGAASSNGGVVISETNSKQEDSFDGWGRERASQLVDANHLLKNESPWAKDRKEGEETSVDLPQEGDQTKNARYVVSARPGTVVFVEVGVEFSRPAKEWEPLTEKTKLEAGDKLRTAAHTFAELTMLPDVNLRIDGKSEILFEELSNEAISLRLLHGSAIFDVARFDKEGPPIRLAGPSTSVTIADDGNYRIDIKPGGDEITVRGGKVFLKGRSVGSCRKITGERVLDCERKETDNFDVWSNHRGEGKHFDGDDVLSRVAHLDRLRRVRFRNTGFWFQNPGKTDFTFVPFSSTRFRSPYGGSYSTVLSPRRVPITRPDYGPRAPFGRGPAGPVIARPQP